MPGFAGVFSLAGVGRWGMESVGALPLQQEVEAMRTNAYYLGGGITTAAFVANEFARLSMRSRK